MVYIFSHESHEWNTNKFISVILVLLVAKKELIVLFDPILTTNDNERSRTFLTANYNEL